MTRAASRLPPPAQPPGRRGRAPSSRCYDASRSDAGLPNPTRSSPCLRDRSACARRARRVGPNPWARPADGSAGCHPSVRAPVPAGTANVSFRSTPPYGPGTGVPPSLLRCSHAPHATPAVRLARMRCPRVAPRGGRNGRGRDPDRRPERRRQPKGRQRGDDATNPTDRQRRHRFECPVREWLLLGCLRRRRTTWRPTSSPTAMGSRLAVTRAWPSTTMATSFSSTSIPRPARVRPP